MAKILVFEGVSGSYRVYAGSRSKKKIMLMIKSLRQSFPAIWSGLYEGVSSGRFRCLTHLRSSRISSITTSRIWIVWLSSLMPGWYFIPRVGSNLRSFIKNSIYGVNGRTTAYRTTYALKYSC